MLSHHSTFTILAADYVGTTTFAAGLCLNFGLVVVVLCLLRLVFLLVLPPLLWVLHKTAGPVSMDLFAFQRTMTGFRKRFVVFPTILPLAVYCHPIGPSCLRGYHLVVDKIVKVYLARVCDSEVF